MSEVVYPRPGESPNDADRLRDLADGYFRLGPVLLGTALVGYPIQAILIVGFNGVPILIPITFLTTTAIVGRLTMVPMRKIARASGWSTATPLALALLLGFTAPFCCGFCGFPIVMGFALRHMRRLGVRVGFFGPTREGVYARWRTLAESQRANDHVKNP